MKNQKANPARKSAWLSVGFIAVVLVILFWRSFDPEYVFFSNDGPLGEENAAWQAMPAGITGMWIDLNYLGTSGGADTPSITAMLHIILQPLYYAKFYPLVALFILGMGAWTLFRQLKLSPMAALLGALATILNSTFFSTACWGVASQEIAAGMNCFALALIVGIPVNASKLLCWTRVALAGLCVGMNVMEAADIGLLYSILVAVFIFFHSLAMGEGTMVKRATNGIARVAVVTIFALFIAAQAVLSLVGIGVLDTGGTSQETESKAAHWDWATQWSLPKAETAGLVIPGLFGYKMDTPKNMSWFQDSYTSGAYWGGMGRDPAIDRYFDSGGQQTPPQGFMRFTGGGNYCGILVALVAAWAIAQALRRKDSVFPGIQKRVIQFWAVVLLLCLLCTWGRFAPFYSILYEFPYFSIHNPPKLLNLFIFPLEKAGDVIRSIRNPAKFLNFFSLALVILFAYGVDALGRRYLDATVLKVAGVGEQFKGWWARKNSFDRKWAFASIALFVIGVLGWMIYSAEKPALITYLQKVGFGGTDPLVPDSAAALANFSIGQLAWGVVLLTIAIILMLLIIAGCFNGPRAKIGLALLGGFLLFDMGRANLPWLVDWDYVQKYEVGSLNPVVQFLATKPYEHRVAALPFEPQQQLRDYDYLFGGSGIYRIEWMQHHFPYYNVQSLDIVQMPRMPADMQAFKEALAPHDPSTYPLLAREWQLTDTRYLLGAVMFLPALNEELDPQKHRFQIAQRFDIEAKPGIAHPSGLEELTAVTNNDGDLALFEFTGALPRVKIYSNWQVNTNDQANLKLLGDLNFDPAKTVLVSTPADGLAASATNENSGTVDFKSYATTHIVLSAQTTGPSVLLLNDKYDSQWAVTVDGRPAKLLRCNFMMRGVYIPTAGQHTVDFEFHLPHKPLYVTVAGILVGIVLCGILAFASRPKPEGNS